MASSTEPKRDKQVRFRVYAAEDEHLIKAAQDAGFEDKSAYLRAVLLAKHVVVVREEGVVLIPAATASKEAQQKVAGLLVEILEQLAAEESSQAAGSTASEPPDPAPASTGAGGAPAGDGGGFGGSEEAGAASGDSPSPSPETSPGEGERLVGTQEPPASIGAAGSIPGPEGISPPPADLTPEQAAADLAADPSAVAPPADPHPALGPDVQPGETFEIYLDRRTAELKYQGRPTVIARYEAEAEYRRYAGAAIADAGVPQAQIEQPTPGPIACSQCGALKRSPGPCPDCGAPA
jgi:hypothetical protein